MNWFYFIWSHCRCSAMSETSRIIPASGVKKSQFRKHYRAVQIDIHRLTNKLIKSTLLKTSHNMIGPLNNLLLLLNVMNCLGLTERNGSFWTYCRTIWLIGLLDVNQLNFLTDWKLTNLSYYLDIMHPHVTILIIATNCFISTTFLPSLIYGKLNSIYIGIH